MSHFRTPGLPLPKPYGCDSCYACCCRLEALLMPEDDVPERLTTQDHWGAWVMTRLEDGWCAALDRSTLRCTIYARRPTVCRAYELGGHDCREQRKLAGLPVPM